MVPSHSAPPLLRETSVLFQFESSACEEVRVDPLVGGARIGDFLFKRTHRCDDVTLKNAPEPLFAEGYTRLSIPAA
jgi:hypothetical protein